MDEATELWNAFHAREYALGKDTPGNVWWHAQAMHPAIFRALRMDPAELGAIYAAAAFRLYRDEDGARVLIALPCPPLFSDDGDDWLGIDTVLEWSPPQNRITVMRDHAANNLVGRVDEKTCHIFSDAFAFARALAEARAQFFTLWAFDGGEWRQRPREPDLTPGLFLVGAPDKVAWPTSIMPADVVCHGADARAVGNAMLRQARIPRPRAANYNEMKAA